MVSGSGKELTACQGPVGCVGTGRKASVLYDPFDDFEGPKGLRRHTVDSVDGLFCATQVKPLSDQGTCSVVLHWCCGGHIRLQMQMRAASERRTSRFRHARRCDKAAAIRLHHYCTQPQPRRPLHRS